MGNTCTHWIADLNNTIVNRSEMVEALEIFGPPEIILSYLKVVLFVLPKMALLAHCPVARSAGQ